MVHARKVIGKNTALLTAILLLGVTLRVLGVTPATITGMATQEEPVNITGDYKEWERIKITTFNGGVLGPTKSGNATILADIHRIIAEADITSIQEIRDASNTTVERLANGLPPDYAYTISPREGRTRSKEEILVAYNASRVTLLNTSSLPDQPDIYERDPYITVFTADNFTFTAVHAHVKPSDAEAELIALRRVLENKSSWILLGDLNADCSYYDETQTFEEWLIPSYVDTTTSSTNCTYDQFVATEQAADNFVGYAVDNTPSYVSDHYAVTAYFHTTAP